MTDDQHAGTRVELAKRLSDRFQRLNEEAFLAIIVEIEVDHELRRRDQAPVGGEDATPILE